MCEGFRFARVGLFGLDLCWAALRVCCARFQVWMLVGFLGCRHIGLLCRGCWIGFCEAGWCGFCT